MIFFFHYAYMNYSHPKIILCSLLADDAVLQPVLRSPSRVATGTPSPRRRQGVAQVSPDERPDANGGIGRFDHINPANVPVAASLPTTNDESVTNEHDNETQEPPTAYRRIMSPAAQRAANQVSRATRKSLPVRFYVGKGRDAFAKLLQTLKGYGFERFHKSRTKWFKDHTNNLFDKNKRERREDDETEWGIYSK